MRVCPSIFRLIPPYMPTCRTNVRPSYFFCCPPDPLQSTVYCARPAVTYAARSAGWKRLISSVKLCPQDGSHLAKNRLLSVFTIFYSFVQIGTSGPTPRIMFFAETLPRIVVQMVKMFVLSAGYKVSTLSRRYVIPRRIGYFCLARNDATVFRLHERCSSREHP